MELKLKSAKPRGGRPTKLTPEAVTCLLKALRGGCLPETACDMAGISRSLYFSIRGSTRAEHAALQVQIDQALAHAENHLVGRIRRAATRQWQAAAWMLERRWPRTWARREIITGAGDGPITVAISSADVRQRLADRLARRAARRKTEDLAAEGGDAS